jgi:hypothetical protein
MGVPINVRTRGYETEFTQIGILTRDRGAGEPDRDDARSVGRAKYQDMGDGNGGGNVPRSDRADSSVLYDNQILPLMGRRVMNGRDKYQYYTLGGANGSTKLPIRVKGRDCIGEYGCDEIMGGDTVYVQGYGHRYRAEVYDNALYRYLPAF